MQCEQIGFGFGVGLSKANQITEGCFGIKKGKVKTGCETCKEFHPCHGMINPAAQLPFDIAPISQVIVTRFMRITLNETCATLKNRLKLKSNTGCCIIVLRKFISR